MSGLALVFVTLGGCLTLNPFVNETVPNVEKTIAHDLPVGTPRENVQAWLDARKIEASYARNWPHDSDIRHLKIDETTSTGIIRAMIRDTDYSFLVSGSISIVFVFDQNDCLSQSHVRWIRTGL